MTLYIVTEYILDTDIHNTPVFTEKEAIQTLLRLAKENGFNVPPKPGISYNALLGILSSSINKSDVILTCSKHEIKFPVLNNNK